MTTAAGKRKTESGLKRKHLREYLIAYALVAPATLVTLVFYIYPVVSAAWNSLLSGIPIPNRYNGLDHYLTAIGSLAYFLLFALAFIFCFVAFQAWQRFRTEYYQSSDPALWFLIPGALTAFGTIGALIIMVPMGFEWQYLWVPALSLVGGLAGFIYLSNRIIYKGNASIYVLNSWLMMLLSLMAVLFSVYTYNQIEERTETAREVAMLVFNYDISNANPQQPAVNPQLTSVELAEQEVPIQIEVNDEVYEVFLSDLAYQNVPLNIEDGESPLSFTLELAPRESANVYFPISRGMGLGEIQYQYQTRPGELQVAAAETSEGNDLLGSGSSDDQEETTAEGLQIPINLTEDSVLQSERDIYLARDVGGEKLLDRNAYTMPASQPLNAGLGILICMAAIYFIGRARIQFDPEEERPLFTVALREQLNMLLGILRLIFGLVAIGLFMYLVTAILLYRDAAYGLEVLARDAQAPYELAYFQATGQVPTERASNLAADLYFLPQLLTMSIGALMIWIAYLVWSGAKNRESNSGFGGSLMLSLMLMVGGWLLISEIPQAIAVAGPRAEEAQDALIRTAIYSLGTVPVQLALGLSLAYFLFYEVKKGKSMYRLVYFMPYISPQIATATVFGVIFSLRPNSLANQLLNALGVEEQRWLHESAGVFQIIYEVLGGDPSYVPSFIEGPSLALTTVILFNIWVYSGYNAVIFLAGLGSVPGELYEAAKVDGAGRWSAFRNITLPLLSPVTFFLTMLGVIGTFRAFGSIYVLKKDGVNAVNTLSIEIFDNYYRDGNIGYASSLAFILFGVILVLTIVQNQLAKDRVFYG